MEKENKYIGDDAFNKLLQHYKCDVPLGVIKMRFAGAICSPNLELRPSDVISSLWPSGQSPRLETKDEADLFFKFFMGLWDDIFEKIAANKLSLPTHIRKADNLRNYCLERFAEIEQGYAEGFWGGKQDLKIAAFLAEIIDSLSDLAAVYLQLEKKLDKSDKTDEIIKTLEHTDGMVEKAISFIIENSVLPRIDSLRRTVN